MASVSSLGAGTKLELGTLYDSLQTAEEARLTPLTTQKTSYNAKLTAWSVVKSGMEKVQTAAAALQDTSKIAQTKVSSTNTAITATLASNAAAGNYSIEVQALAQSQSLLSKAATSKDAELGTAGMGTRTITISQPGQTKPMTVNLEDDKTSLADIRDAINKQQGSVSASIMKADDNTYYLSLTSSESGVKNKMTVTSSDPALSAYIGYDASKPAAENGMTEKVAAQDAVVSINNVTITRSSNTITDAPEGVTLALNATNVGKPETLTVTKDNAPMTTAIQNFVDAYNSLQTTIASQTKFTAVAQGTTSQNSSNGDLMGDGTLRNIQTQLRSMLSNTQSGGDISSLAQMGVTQDITGKLTVDSTKLTKALDEKPAGVVNFLSGDGKTTGFATQTNKLLTGMLGSDGALESAKSGINASIKQLDERATAITESITATMARYKTQFTALSQLVSSMDSTANYLSAQFSALS